METILVWSVVGAVTGWLATMEVPGADPGGIIGNFFTITGNLLVGIVGAVAGGLLFNAFIGHQYGAWAASTAGSFIGAMVLLLALRVITCKRLPAR